MPHDLLIRNATIVDGSGNPSTSGDVAIDRDRMVAVGSVKDRAIKEIDADGRVLAPGFIDVHTHSDLMLLHCPEHQLSLIHI